MKMLNLKFMVRIKKYCYYHREIRKVFSSLLYRFQSWHSKSEMNYRHNSKSFTMSNEYDSLLVVMPQDFPGITNGI